MEGRRGRLRENEFEVTAAQLDRAIARNAPNRVLAGLMRRYGGGHGRPVGVAEELERVARNEGVLGAVQEWRLEGVDVGRRISVREGKVQFGITPPRELDLFALPWDALGAGVYVDLEVGTPVPLSLWRKAKGCTGTMSRFGACLREFGGEVPVGLRRLRLYRCGVGREELLGLSEAFGMETLEELDISGGEDVSAELVASVARAGVLHVRNLSFHGSCGLGLGQIGEALLGVDCTPRLRSLVVSDDKAVEEEGMRRMLRVLGGRPEGSGVVRLKLASDDLGGAVVGDIVELLGPRGDLQWLSLSGNRGIGNADVALFCQHEWPRLTFLSTWRCNLSYAVLSHVKSLADRTPSLHTALILEFDMMEDPDGESWVEKEISAAWRRRMGFA